MQKTIHVLAFGIARDILGYSDQEIALAGPLTVGEFRHFLMGNYPELARLNSLAIAINAEYAQDDQLITPGDEVVLIPPVSGG